MRLRQLLERVAPQSLFWRLVTVWVLCFVVLRLYSMTDISMRSDDVFLRILAGTEARYMALHMRLLAYEPYPVRMEFIRQLGRDKELWVNQISQPTKMKGESSPLSQDLARQMRIHLVNAGLPVLQVRAALRVWPREKDDADRGRPEGRKALEVAGMDVPKSDYGILLWGKERAALAETAVEYAPGVWVHMVHYVDILPNTALYFNLSRVLYESIIMIMLALTTLFWIVRPLQTLAQATEAFGRDMDTPPLSETEGSLEIRNAARAFNSMRERLVSFVRERSTLLAAVSHDLRTPLTRMRLRLENAEDPRLRAALLADVEEVQQSLEQIIGMVRTLNAADPEEADRVDFMALMESMVEDMQDMKQEVTLHGTVPGSYWLPPTLTLRCLQNVICNAVRYGERAEVYVALNGDFLCVVVLDNGPGIPPDRQEMVFEPFYRLEGSRNLKTGGYGMGLAISRALARRCGGDVCLANRPGGGLQATVTLVARPVTN